MSSKTYQCPLCTWQLIDHAVPDDETERELKHHYMSHEVAEWVNLCAALAEENARLQLDVEFYRRGKGA